MTIKISPGNDKLGTAIPNVSLIPIKDCANCDYCRKDCYALKPWRRYKQTRASWTNNSQQFRADPFEAARDVIAQLNRKKKLPRFFRIHVAGDFLNQEHVMCWARVAHMFPGIKFLAFTKRHNLDFAAMPKNVTVIFSQWPGMPDKTPKGFNRAWMQDGTETRIPEDALECPGNCESCGACWGIDRDVWFHKH